MAVVSAVVLSPGHLSDLAFMLGLRTMPTARLYPVPFQASEWRWVAINREVSRRTKPVVRRLLDLGPWMLAARQQKREDSAPAWFAVAPQAAILGASRVRCVGDGRWIYATGKGPVTRRCDGWRCWRCCK
mgnify:CR=1 FL=1